MKQIERNNRIKFFEEVLCNSLKNNLETLNKIETLLEEIIVIRDLNSSSSPGKIEKLFKEKDALKMQSYIYKAIIAKTEDNIDRLKRGEDI